MSDEDDYYTNKSSSRQWAKGSRTLKPARESKTLSRSRRGKSSFEEDEYSADSDNESDDFKSTTKKGTNLRKNNAASAMLTKIGRNSEVRTSSRSVRKVSYVESEESEEIEEGKKKKSQKVEP